MDNDDISLEERIQALSDYMDVVQMKIMRLQNAVQSVAFHLLQSLGEEKTKAIMDEVMKDFGRKK
jgi:hypothetical protein